MEVADGTRQQFAGHFRKVVGLMGAQFEIEFNSDGFREILMSGEVKAELEKLANEVCNKANANVSDPESDGFFVNMMQGNMGGGRWLAFVQAKDWKAFDAEKYDKALTRAMG